MPRCSIIIPVHNRASLTRQCLNAVLLRDSTDVDFEVIVVDDGSIDLTREILGRYATQVRVVAHETNTGFSRACNDGAAAASGEYLVFLNNDTIPENGWLDALVSYADSHPRAAVVGSKLLYPNDTIQHAGVVICQDHMPRHLYAGFPADHPAVNKSRRFQIVTAACALVRRGPFEQVGKFDASFVNGYEDVDLCLRLGENDYEIHYCHQSVLYHLESVSEGRFDHERDNDALYRRRWASRVEPDDLRYYLEDGLMALSYTDSCPLRLTISPLLAVLNADQRDREADQLLGERSRQVFDLLKENIRLNVRLRELELATTAHRSTENGRSNSDTLVKPIVPPRPFVRGQIHSLSQRSSSRLISVLLPTKNGAPLLRELLPRILDQRIDDRVEIVAVDSGSTDDTIDVLRQFHATVVAIDPRTYNHGLTRNLAATYAKGNVLVFVNQSTLPSDDSWLANLVAPLEEDPLVAGVCSRVQPRHDADLINQRDGLRDPSGSPERSIRAITDWSEYRALPHHQLRLLINFHTVSAAIRPTVFRRIPFREVATIGEDILWAKEVLEAGLKIQHEPSSVVFHSHNYSYFEILQRNVDDGMANREIVGRTLKDDEVVPTISALVRDDWHFLETETSLDAAGLEHWRLVSALRRTAQIVGQWVGVNHDRISGDMVSALSLTHRLKSGEQHLPISPRST